MDELRERLKTLAVERSLYWKHRKTSMIAKSISMTVNLLDEEPLLVRVCDDVSGRIPTLIETVPRARMEESFMLTTPEAYKQAFEKLPVAEGLHYTVDLEAGTATRSA